MKSTTSSATSSKEPGKICLPCLGKMKIRTLDEAAAASQSLKKEGQVAGVIVQYGAIGLLHLARLHFEASFQRKPSASDQLLAGLFDRFETILAKRLQEEVGDESMSQIVANLIVNFQKIGIRYLPPTQ